MSIQVAVERLLEVRGYEGGVDNRGDGTMEILAYAKGTKTDAKHFIGPIQQAAGWANKLADISGPTKEELAAIEAKAASEWDEEYGNLTEEGVRKILEQDGVIEAPAEVAESPAVAEAPIAAPEKPKTQKDPKEGGSMSIVQKLFGSKKQADVVSTSLPSLIPTEEVHFLPKADVVQAMNKGLDNCVIVRLDYQARGGHISSNRAIRVANVVDDRVFAWDMAEYVREKARLLTEAPEGQSPEVSAQMAAKAAQRTFLLRSVMGVRVTADPVEPINPGFPNAYVVRPMTLDAVATRGNGFPRAVNPQAVPALLEMGFEVVEAGK